MKKGGFTLIELSIVLVIIALIVGGVLTGRQLIATAENRAQIAQVESLKRAMATFKLKYNCLAGDCANEAQLGLYNTYRWTASGAEMLGNGFIDGTVTNNLDMWYAFHQLRQTGLIDCKCDMDAYVAEAGFQYSDMIFPRTKNGKTWLIMAGGGSLTNYGGSVSVLPKNYIYISHRYWPFTPEQAYYFDTKMDDGLPLTGAVNAVGNTYNYSIVEQWYGTMAPSSGAGGPSAAYCVNSSTTPNSYNTQNDSVQCAVRFELGL